MLYLKSECKRTWFRQIYVQRGADRFSESCVQMCTGASTDGFYKYIEQILTVFGP